jgi:5-methylcytosine-specific restriction endonuclease McrA
MPRKGQRLTEEQRKKISESRKTLTPEQRERIAAAQRGRVASPETRAKMSAAHMGHPVSDKVRAAIGNAHRGKTVSKKSKELNRQKHLGNVMSDETREKMRKSHLGENNHFYGKHHSEETLKKLTGRPFSDIHKANLSAVKKGIVPPNIEILKASCLGKPMSEEHRKNHIVAMSDKETREKMSMSKRGEQNPNWNEGVTPLYKNIRECAKYYEWRDAVYKRDDYCDVITGERGNGNLNAHHITPFAEIIEKHHITTFEEAMACDELWDVSNGITMIEANHILYHARTGKPE